MLTRLAVMTIVSALLAGCSGDWGSQENDSTTISAPLAFSPAVSSPEDCIARARSGNEIGLATESRWMSSNGLAQDRINCYVGTSAKIDKHRTSMADVQIALTEISFATDVERHFFAGVSHDGDAYLCTRLSHGAKTLIWMRLRGTPFRACLQPYEMPGAFSEALFVPRRYFPTLVKHEDRS